MNAGKVIVERLQNQTTAANKVYPLIMPDGAEYPAITYQTVSIMRTHAMGADSPILRVRMQVDCWGSTYASAQTLAGEVEGRLSRFRGPAAGSKVLDILLDNQVETYETEAQARRIMMDFSIFITEQ